MSRLPKFARPGRRNPLAQALTPRRRRRAAGRGADRVCRGPPPPPPTDPHDVMVVGDSVAFSFGCVLGDTIAKVNRLGLSRSTRIQRRRTSRSAPARPTDSEVLLYNTGRAGAPNCDTDAVGSRRHRPGQQAADFFVPKVVVINAGGLGDRRPLGGHAQRRAGRSVGRSRVLDLERLHAAVPEGSRQLHQRAVQRHQRVPLRGRQGHPGHGAVRRPNVARARPKRRAAGTRMLVVGAVSIESTDGEWRELHRERHRRERRAMATALPRPHVPVGYGQTGSAQRGHDVRQEPVLPW